MPFSPLLHRTLFFVPAKPKPINRCPRTLYSSVCTAAMATKYESSSDIISENSPETKQNYPRPLSPPLPPISKDIELRRALEASSKSSIFNLTRQDVLYEDDWLLAVNKPKGIYCENVLNSIPAFLDPSADSAGLSEVTRSSDHELHLANRLDRDTSGVMVITKSHKVASKLVKAFTNHEVRKSYIALCVGSAPKWERITLRSGHGRSKFGAWRVYAFSDVGRVLPGGSVVRDMETTFELLSVNGEGSFKELFQCKKDEENVLVVEEEAKIDVDAVKEEILVRAIPRSGRTHQIRLHCQHLGIPIRGDVKYYGVHEWKGRTYDGHELHAESLSFGHPVTGLKIIFHAPLPCWVSEHSSKC